MAPSTSPTIRLSSRVLTLALAVLLLLCTLSYLTYNLFHIAVIANTQHLYDVSDHTTTQSAHSHQSPHHESTSATKLSAIAPHSPPTPTHNNPNNEPINTPAVPSLAQSTAASPRVAILIVGDSNAAKKYAQHWASLRCYAHRWGYSVLVEANDRDKFEACRDMENFYFRKHCTVAHAMLAAMHRFDYFLVVDGDVFVVNAATSLTPWLPSDPRMHVIMYERFHDGEIMAGTYLARSSNASVAYLMQWANMHFTLEPDGQTNNDNGALHLHVVEWLHGRDSPQWKECRRRASGVGSMGQYDAYVGCTKCVMGRRRVWPDKGLQVMRRGHFVARDFFVSSPGDGVPVVDNIGLVGPGDVLFHGWKETITGTWWAEDVDEAVCTKQSDWTPKLRPQVQGSVAEVLAQIRLRDAYVIKDRGGAVPIADVSGCWPKCPAELTAEQEQQIRDRTCPHGLKEYYKTHSD